MSEMVEGVTDTGVRFRGVPVEIRMIERVAKAICGAQSVAQQASGLNEHGLLMTYEQYVEIAWPLFAGHAHKAIAAMRDPTPSMMAAADAVTPNGFHWAIKDGDPVGACRVTYHAMIDEALK